MTEYEWSRNGEPWVPSDPELASLLLGEFLTSRGDRLTLLADGTWVYRIKR